MTLTLLFAAVLLAAAVGAFADEPAADKPSSSGGGKAAAWVAAIVIVALLGVYAVKGIIIPRRQYEKGLALMSEGKFKAAEDILSKIDYKDSKAKAEEAGKVIKAQVDKRHYHQAVSAYKSGDFEKAAAMFAALKAYRNSAELEASARRKLADDTSLKPAAPKLEVKEADFDWDDDDDDDWWDD